MPSNDTLNHPGLWQAVCQLWQSLHQTRRRQLFGLFMLMLLSSVAELVSIGSFFPFISELSLGASTHVQLLAIAQTYFSGPPLQSTGKLFLCTIIVAGLLRITVLFCSTRLSAQLGVELRQTLYHNILGQDYPFHVKQHSSHLMSLLNGKVREVIHADIMHLLLFVNAFVVIMVLIAGLYWLNGKLAFVIFGALGSIYVVIAYGVKRAIRANGDILNTHGPQAIHQIQQGLGGIRDIIMDSQQAIFLHGYTKVAQKVQYAEMRSVFLANLPKPLVEMLGLSLIVGFTYYQQGFSPSPLPILSVLALGGQRLLPSIQQCYFSWTLIHASHAVLCDILYFLSKVPTTLPAVSQPINWHESIKLQNISFYYDNPQSPILQGINIEIRKGVTLGLIGKTGSGKSTLLDILMGLLSPSQGDIFLDGHSLLTVPMHAWQQHIAHVPQHIFLSNGSICDNIAFGVLPEEIDHLKLKKVATQAQLGEFIATQNLEYQTLIGEGGIRLSGGQRQRLGIARALYKSASILILDEATQALDEETEEKILCTLRRDYPQLTVIIVSHRHSTLKHCQQIYTLEQGQLVRHSK